jgi:CRP-like cAMP-binding protein
MAVEASTVTDTRCVCTHSIAVHGIKGDDPGCSFCSCRRFERPSSAKVEVPLGKYSSSALELLSQTPELKPVPKDALVAFVKDGHGRMFAPGAVLVHRGERSHSLHVVLDGMVLVQKDEDSDGHEVGPGAIAGDLRAFTEEPRWASVVAIDNSLALEVDAGKLQPTFAEHPDFFMSLVQSLGKYSENAEEVVEATVQAALQQQTVEDAHERREGLDPQKQMEIAARWRQIKEDQKAADRAREAARAAIDSQMKKR